MILLTGATGYLGGYALTELLRRTDAPIGLLLRGGERHAQLARLWEGLQLHLDADAFRAALPRLRLLAGDLHAPGLGLDPRVRDEILAETDSILHVAASLNRKSAKACFNTNLRGGLSMLVLARSIAEKRGLRRFSFVSTVAVASEREGEDVGEDDAIDWSRSDYDPYARTKKFGEHMVRELLPDLPYTIFRPAILLGDGHRPETTQFDMARAFVGLAELPVVPLPEGARIDIVNTAWAAEAMVRVHLDDAAPYDTYHLSAGLASPTAGSIRDALAEAGMRRFRLVPALDKGFEWTFRAMNRAPRGTALAGVGGLMKVFWPYIRYNTVFLNDRAVEAVGRPPVHFETYAPELLRWCKANRFRYPAVPLSDGIA